MIFRQRNVKVTSMNHHGNLQSLKRVLNIKITKKYFLWPTLALLDFKLASLFTFGKRERMHAMKTIAFYWLFLLILFPFYLQHTSLNEYTYESTSTTIIFHCTHLLIISFVSLSLTQVSNIKTRIVEKVFYLFSFCWFNSEISSFCRT